MPNPSVSPSFRAFNLKRNTSQLTVLNIYKITTDNIKKKHNGWISERRNELTMTGPATFCTPLTLRTHFHCTVFVRWRCADKLQPNGSRIKIANGCDVTCVASVGLWLDIDMSILIQYVILHVLSCLTSQGPQKHPPKSQKTLGFASKQPTNTLSQMLRSFFHDWWMLW